MSQEMKTMNQKMNHLFGGVMGMVVGVMQYIRCVNFLTFGSGPTADALVSVCLKSTGPASYWGLAYMQSIEFFSFVLNVLYIGH